MATTAAVATETMKDSISKPSEHQVQNVSMDYEPGVQTDPTSSVPPSDETTNLEQPVKQIEQTGQTSFDTPTAATNVTTQEEYIQERMEENQDPDRFTATDPGLAQVLPPTASAVTRFHAQDGGHQLETVPSSSVSPSAPPYEQVVNEGEQNFPPMQTVSFQPHPGIYDSTFQSPPAGTPYTQYTSVPHPGAQQPPYNYPPYAGAPPPPGGGIPPYTQQYSDTSSYASAGTWGSSSFDATPSETNQEEEENVPNVPYVDRSTKPPSLKALSTSWGGVCVCVCTFVRTQLRA